MSSATIESEYVHAVYSRLAGYQKKERNASSPRVWPVVRKFVDQQRIGSTVIDIGCGETKYTSDKVFTWGIDVCADVLAMVNGKLQTDLILADALALPFRDDSADAILLVSVLHHLTTTQRRKAVIQECARCLRPGGRVLIYVWAFEQPNGVFPQQDLLVPWHLHETVINGKLPKIKFHKDTTKEQRIIQASVPIHIPTDENSNQDSTWLGQLLRKVDSVRSSVPFLSQSNGTVQKATPPPATPKMFPQTKQSILLGIKRWSPMLGRRLASLIVSIEEQLADEMTEKIMNDALTETMATLKEMTFYRFYHVFKKGELESLVNTVAGLNVVQSSFEHGNWSVVVEKEKESTIRI